MRIRSKQIDQAQQLDLELALSADELNGLLRGYEGYEATAPARASLRLRTADKAYALTGSLVSLGLIETVDFLGREEVLKRIHNALALLKV